MARVLLLVIDGLGCGAQEDAALYGDAHANTLAHVCEVTNLALPNFQKMGIGNIIPIKTILPVTTPVADFGKMREKSAGKDSTTGHWEMAGVYLEKPFPVFPDGFSEDLMKLLCRITGSEAPLLCNKPYSGSEVIQDFGDEHVQTGIPILYTSADSVLQIAAHVDIIPVETLYAWCDQIRSVLKEGPFAVGRVIARPFTGAPGRFERVSEERKDFSLVPPSATLMDTLRSHGVHCVSVGKVIDLFADTGFDQYIKTQGNTDGIRQINRLLKDPHLPENSFIFANLIDTDQLYGHRNDAQGYAACLAEIDTALPEIMSGMKHDDLLIITGDHGNDPTDVSTDHTREFVPLLICTPKTQKGNDLGMIDGFGYVSHRVKQWLLPSYPH